MFNIICKVLTVIFLFLAIILLFKRQKSLNKFEAIWICLLVYSWIMYGVFSIRYNIPLLSMIFWDISGFFLWLISLFALRRPKFQHRGVIIATCLVGLISYLILFGITYTSSNIVL